MFLSLKKLHQDNSGVIMITVLVLVLVLTVVAIGILGVNISQVSTSQSVVDSIKAEQLAIGAFYQYHQQQIDGNGTTPTSETMDNKTFSISINAAGAGSGPNNTNPIQVSVNYI